jgi:hydroxymethylglutaryl-CoA lyase
MADRVTIFEVGPRDGLQNEAKQIATVDKIALVDRLSACGFAKIEAASFVSPKWVPQMGDATEVMAGINRADGVRYAALTPNMRGLEAARAAGVDEVAIFGSATEGFSQANINCSKAEALARFAPVAEASDVPVRGYVSCVIACPYDGPVAPEDVADMAEKLLALGCYEVSLGDTIGAGTPKRVDAMLDAVLERVPAEALAGHFHDTGGRAVENVEASYTRGLRVFDAAVGGLGGCPYAPGAAGNVASEALVARFAQLGVETGIDAARLAEAGAFARGLRG